MITTLRKIIKFLDIIKILINSDEYYLVTSSIVGTDIGEHSTRKYDYLDNTKRKIFYTFVELNLKEKMDGA